MVNGLVIPGDVIAITSKDRLPGENTRISDGKILATVAGRIKTYSKDNLTYESVVPLKPTYAVPNIGSIILAKVVSLSSRIVRCDIVAVDNRPLAGPFRGQIRKEDIRSVQRDQAEPADSFRPGDIVRAKVINMVGPGAGGHTSGLRLRSCKPGTVGHSLLSSAHAASVCVRATNDQAAQSSSTTTWLLSTAEPDLGVILAFGRPYSSLPTSDSANVSKAGNTNPLSTSIISTGSCVPLGGCAGTPLLPASWTEMICPRTLAKYPRKVARVPDELLCLLAK